jgi:hypothetical protein
VTPSELAGFKRFCAEILDLRLEPFQVKIAHEVFSDRRETLVLLPRGNGKSTLLAASGLWPYSAPSSRRWRSALRAVSKRPCSSVSRARWRRIRLSPHASKSHAGEIRTANGWLNVVASDGAKQHGLILSLVARVSGATP